MKLGPQDKLALALTSAGSMRNLAALVGVSHQKIGRWLREGHPGGVKEIPPEALPAIDAAFRIHADLARDQARADRTPYIKAAPVYAERKPLRTGAIGMRVFVENTAFIKRDVRMKVMEGMQQSKQMLSASVRSRVDIHRYAKQAAANELADRKRRGQTPRITQRELAKRIQAGIENKQAREIRAEPVLRELFTKYENIMPTADTGRAISGIERKLREKHEPATGAPGTQLADQYLFQLLTKQPKKARNDQGTPRSSSRRSTRGRGPK